MARRQQKKKESRLLPLVCSMLILAVLLPAVLSVPTVPDPTVSIPPEPETLPQSPLTPSDFMETEGYLACAAAETMTGIDVSRYQGAIDYSLVKASGIDFVIVRLGYRAIGTGELHEDVNAAQNLRSAREAGLLVGAYFYSQACTPEEARQEARYALEILDSFPLDLPLSFDWEIETRTENVDVQTATDCAIAFCEAVESAQLQSMIYFNTYQALSRLDLARLTAYPWWLAMYDRGESFPCRFDIWQYTQTGTVAGIEGSVDINILLLPD